MREGSSTNQPSNFNNNGHLGDVILGVDDGSINVAPAFASQVLDVAATVVSQAPLQPFADHALAALVCLPIRTTSG